MEEVKRINRTLIHKGKIVDFYEDTMQFADGRTAVWDLLDHKGAAAVIPVDNDGKIIMVKQYRNAPERFTIELPAGGVNYGENKMQTALRELEEETGYRTDKVEHLIDIYTTFAFCNEVIGIYIATDLVKTSQHLDEDEEVQIERYTLEELTKLILNGTIQDAKTISGILAYKEWKEKTR